MNTKTLYRNRRTKRLCRRSDPQAEALEVPTKRFRLVSGRLYRFEVGEYVVERGRPYELVRAGDGEQLRAVPLRPMPREPEPTPLFGQMTGR